MSPHLAATTMLFAVAAAMMLVACDRDDNRTAGQKLDAGIAKTEQRVEETKAEFKKDSAEANAALRVGAEKAANRVEQAADKAAQAINQAANDVAVKASDAAITTQLNAELAKDPYLSAQRIDVDTRGGGVTLSGSAPDRAAKDRATQLAAGIKGVIRVDNRLEIRS